MNSEQMQEEYFAFLKHKAAERANAPTTITIDGIQIVVDASWANHISAQHWTAHVDSEGIVPTFFTNDVGQDVPGFIFGVADGIFEHVDGNFLNYQRANLQLLGAE